MPSSYDILSVHYNGPPHDSPISINSKDSISGKTFKPGTASSFGYGSSTYYKEGKDAVFRTSGGNEYRSLLDNAIKFGPKFQIDDERMPEWIAVATINHPSRIENDLIPPMANHITIEGKPWKLYLPHSSDTPVKLYAAPDAVFVGPMNQRGYLVSEIEDLRETVRSMLKGGEFYKETRAWMRFLAEKGFTKAGKSNGFGTEVGDAYAAFHPLYNYFVSGDKWTQRVINRLEQLGARLDRESIRTLKRAIIRHEMAHAAGVDPEHFSEPGMEKLLGELEYEFSTKLAERNKGTKYESQYHATAKFGKEYAQMWRKRGGLLDKLSPNYGQSYIPDGVIVALNAEANAVADAKGLKGESKQRYIQYHVKSRINEMYQNVLPLVEEHSREGNLEKIVNEKSTDSKPKGKLLKFYDKGEKSKYESKEHKEEKQSEEEPDKDNKVDSDSRTESKAA